MSGWKVWLGVISGLIAAVAAALGADLKPEQLDAIQLLVVSLIGLGLGHKAEKNKAATEALTSQTASVAQKVAKVADKVDVVVRVAKVADKMETNK